MNEIKDTVKALRWFAKVTTHCEHNIVSCPECEFNGFCTDPYSDDGICKMHECLTAAASLIESLQSDAASYQQIKKTLSDEGFSDLTTMISRYKQVMAVTSGRAVPANIPATAKNVKSAWRLCPMTSHIVVSHAPAGNGAACMRPGRKADESD